eukprot:12431508-Karenia_brevis.AAC.1
MAASSSVAAASNDFQHAFLSDLKEPTVEKIRRVYLQIKVLAPVEISALQNLYGEFWHAEAVVQESMLHKAECDCAVCEVRRRSKEAEVPISLGSQESTEEAMLLAAAEAADKNMRMLADASSAADKVLLEMEKISTAYAAERAAMECRYGETWLNSRGLTASFTHSAACGCEPCVIRKIAAGKFDEVQAAAKRVKDCSPAPKTNNGNGGVGGKKKGRSGSVQPGSPSKKKKALHGDDADIMASDSLPDVPSTDPELNKDIFDDLTPRERTGGHNLHGQRSVEATANDSDEDDFLAESKRRLAALQSSHSVGSADRHEKRKGGRRHQSRSSSAKPISVAQANRRAPQSRHHSIATPGHTSHSSADDDNGERAGGGPAAASGEWSAVATRANSVESESFRKVLAKLQGDFEHHVALSTQQNEKLLRSVQNCSGEILQATTELVAERLKPVQNAIDDHSNELEYLRSTHMEFAARIAKLEKALEQTSYDTAIHADPKYDAKPIKTILRANCDVLVTKRAVQLALAEYLDKDAENQWEVVSDRDVSRFHTISFKGPAAVAAKRAQKAMDILYNGGQWHEVFVNAPSGARKRLFVSPDKSPKQIRQERVCKILARIMEKRLDVRVYGIKAKGIIIADERALIQVNVDEKEAPPLLYWKLPTARDLRINKSGMESIAAELSQSLAPKSDSIPWSLSSWNGRAVLHNKPFLRRKKLRVEFHGSKCDISLALKRLSSTHHVFISDSGQPDKGGLVTLIKRSFACQAHLDHKVIAMGRVQRVCIQYGFDGSKKAGAQSMPRTEAKNSSLERGGRKGGMFPVTLPAPPHRNLSIQHGDVGDDDDACTIVIWNLHNYGINEQELLTLEGLISADCVRAQSDPSRFFLCALGDLNQSSAEQQRVALAGDKFLRQCCGDVGGGAMRKTASQRFERCFENLIEISQSKATCIHKGSKSEAVIDRIFLGTAAWMVKHLSVQSTVIRSPL